MFLGGPTARSFAETSQGRISRPFESLDRQSAKARLAGIGQFLDALKHSLTADKRQEERDDSQGRVLHGQRSVVESLSDQENVGFVEHQEMIADWGRSNIDRTPPLLLCTDNSNTCLAEHNLNTREDSSRWIADRQHLTSNI